MSMTEEIKYYEDLILHSLPKTSFSVDSSWAKGLPNKAGVYAFFYGSEFIYVGETKSIRDRMKDLRRTVNHTFRRKLGAHHFSDTEGFEPATSKRKFPERIEALVDKLMGKLSVVYLPIPFGRSEVEEYLIKEYSPQFNSLSSRGNA